MNSAFIFHGTAGHPQENWFPWLKKELEELGYDVIVPQFPTPKNQTLENWFKVFEQYREKYTQNTILIGHSLGGAFLLRVLEKYNIKVKAAHVIAAPIGIRPIKNWESDQPFIGQPFDWEKIKSRCAKFYVFHSKDDPYVGFGNGQELARSVGTKIISVSDAGHFNAKTGYTRFDLLLEKIKER